MSPGKHHTTPSPTNWQPLNRATHSRGHPTRSPRDIEPPRTRRQPQLHSTIHSRGTHGTVAQLPKDTHCPRASQCSNTHVTQHTQPRGCADTHRHIKERTRRLGTHRPTDRDGTTQTQSPANTSPDSRADRFGGSGVPKRTPRMRMPPTRADRTPEPSSAATDARGPGARGAEIR